MSRSLITTTGTSPVIIYMNNSDYIINTDGSCIAYLPNPAEAPIGYELTIFGADDTTQGETFVNCIQGTTSDFRFDGVHLQTVYIPSLKSATFKNLGNTWAVVSKG
jgi:hypothetical protein